jgi:hypothetical protein
MTLEHMFSSVTSTFRPLSWDPRLAVMRTAFLHLCNLLPCDRCDKIADPEAHK